MAYRNGKKIVDEPIRIGQERDLMAELEALDDAELFGNAQETDWITEGISKVEQKQIKDKSHIAFEIAAKRSDMGMSQKEFAKFMGVSQVMVSKWESGDYNFTLDTLNEVCFKLGMDFKPQVSVNKNPENRCKVTGFFKFDKSYDSNVNNKSRQGVIA